MADDKRAVENAQQEFEFVFKRSCSTIAIRPINCPLFAMVPVLFFKLVAWLKKAKREKGNQKCAQAEKRERERGRKERM